MLDRAPRVVLMDDAAVRSVQVVECGEVLVSTEGAVAFDGREDDGTGRPSWVRARVREMLAEAASLLAPKYELVLNEGWRPPHVQSHYFDRQVERLNAIYPASSRAELVRLASRFVSPPDVAPHPTGAAVDVLLRDASGREVDMGCPIDASPEASKGLCFTNHPDVPPTGRRARADLSAAMQAAGFVNYPTEWWHWSFGDRYWAMATGADHAPYGPQSLDR
jgi:D-alanyl-D-alanine dipeptidase